MAASNINNHFFDGSYKEAWRGIIPDGLSEAEAEFLIKVGNLNPGDQVLDFMCGYGRHTLPLARAGIRVTAVDNQADYIDEIDRAAKTEKLPVQAIQADIMEAKLTGPFQLASCMGNSFAFFNREDAQSLLNTLASLLQPTGVLVINSWMIAEIAIKYFREKDWHYAGDYKCLLDYQYHFNPSRIESEQTIIAPNGNIETVKGVDYIFTLDELEQMFREAGLRTTGLFSTPRLKKFVLGDVRIYITAEKI